MRMFPILNDPVIQEVPWDFIEPHEAQALRNHNQSLEQLAQRGGLSCAELFYVLQGERWPVGRGITRDQARDFVVDALTKFYQGSKA